ncbi:Serine-threonine/tyrosine-protein kinase catalytic domain [Trinorchestia longiramus]|nr:Serine-threonine/tyrosine-protein kinase catalytic domain [Trinorchestia longiramus]
MPSGELWRGRWQNNDIVAKILRLRAVTARICRDFNDEFPKLRIFSHPNVLPVVGCCNSPPNLVVITQYLPYGSLYNVLHQVDGNIVLDTAQALKWALDITKGMGFIHSLNKVVPNLYLSSKHVMIDDDLTAKICMADAKFSFQERGKIYSPQWFSPEALVKKQKDLNIKAADMWSFAIVLWEMATREVPFAEYSPMEAGMKISNPTSSSFKKISPFFRRRRFSNTAFPYIIICDPLYFTSFHGDPSWPFYWGDSYYGLPVH